MADGVYIGCRTVVLLNVPAVPDELHNNDGLLVVSAAESV